MAIEMVSIVSKQAAGCRGAYIRIPWPVHSNVLKQDGGVSHAFVLAGQHRALSHVGRASMLDG